MIFNLGILTWCLVCTISQGEAENLVHSGSDFMRFVNFVKHPFHYLNTTNIFSQVFASDFTECAFQCMQTPSCVSVNMAVSPGNNKLFWCDLLASDKYSSSKSFQENATSHHFSIMSPCFNNPCRSGVTCKPNYNDGSYECEAYKRNCAEIYKSGERRDGVYTIKPDNVSAFDVFCDQTTAGGGWTVFQKRLDGSVDFYLNWSDYKHGFGDLRGEFWLGLDKIHHLTSDNGSMLRVDLEDFEGNTNYAEYDMFGVKSENDKYQLILGSYTGTAGDSLYIHRGKPFSTQDQDNDDKPGENCASAYHGAWWYNSCHNSNLNGLYHRGAHASYASGVNWKYWKGYYYSLKRTEMKIRPVDY